MFASTCLTLEVKLITTSTNYHSRDKIHMEHRLTIIDVATVIMDNETKQLYGSYHSYNVA
jgi:hypothetical protein